MYPSACFFAWSELRVLFSLSNKVYVLDEENSFCSSRGVSTFISSKATFE